jgi:hypothetical protein
LELIELANREAKSWHENAGSAAFEYSEREMRWD